MAKQQISATTTTMMATLLAAVFFATGCARINAPTGFVQIKNAYGYDFKAVSARGSVFAMNSRTNPSADGTPEFWAQAVEHQKVELDGYRLENRSEIKTTSGPTGVLFDLRVGSGSAEYTYLLGLYVNSQAIVTIEAGGPSKQIAEEREKILTAMESLRM